MTARQIARDKVLTFWRIRFSDLHWTADLEDEQNGRLLMYLSSSVH